MAAKEKLDSETKQKILDAFHVSDLREHQVKAIDALIKRNDVFVGTKTGSGKSMTYECLPTVFGHDCVALVIAPLLSIMQEQCNRLNGLGFTATYIGKDDEENAQLESGHFQFVFASPEILVSNPRWRSLLTTPAYQENLKAIVVDEAHTVIQWGESRTEEGPFREWFACVGELRSLCLNVPLVALTATSGPLQRRNIMKKLHFKSDFVTVLDSPDRENIKISTYLIKNNAPVNITFRWLIEALLQLGESCQRHVVFCTSIADCSKIYRAFVEKFGFNCGHFQMYHSQTNERVKEKIRQDTSIENGEIRVLICTNAAGMGVNFKNVHNIVHYGLPRELDTFVQQMGRAGRDGQPSDELLLYKCHKSHLKRVEPELVKLVKDSVCRHKQLCEFYLFDHKQIIPQHRCCDICQSSCECGEAECQSEHPCLRYSPPDEDEDQLGRNVKEEDKELLRQRLKALKVAQETSNLGILTSELVHGLTDSVITSVVQKCGRLFTPGDVLKNTACWSYAMSVRIVNVVNSVFDDHELYNTDVESGESDSESENCA